ncbi:FMN-binding protein [Gilvimarinus sp. SDUM040013]|uniref:FMN-binding protein n=1 Tax=Gilvimarinus gilvus TaxID=3058038 RepID=A0ABU4RX55_9GAMM|nr:FMN-binding protein [Gilvimarinus sp. SDUM040013]MDO3386649.1 FMN-binding protein [Gilvimarinus sp. SDUM040013]MDX6849464.1 FMN-binding protein [Gilvimarinus sp. SDUM040013]
MRKTVFIGLLVCLVTLSVPCRAQRGVFLTPEQFHQQAFAGQGENQILWLDGDQLQQAQRILGHRFPGIRTRYVAGGTRTAWIFDEIGKTHPITIGVVVEASEIVQVKILEYRESRGGEVRYDSFTRQFIGGSLIEKQPEPKLDATIDGITGATLSVRAVKKVATLALYFHSLTPVAYSDTLAEGSLP